MRLTFVSGATRVVLADDGDAVSGLQTGLSQQIQVANGIRATAATPLARGNATAALSFTVTYAPARTLEAAQDRLVTFPSTVPTSGYLMHETLGFDGTRQVRFLHNAVRGDITGRHLGLSAILNYQFVGSAWHRTPPTA